MGNILGNGFDPYVRDQINIRQKKLGTLGNISDDTLSWINEKTAWLRLVSSVDFKNDGGNLAKNNILFGGTTKYTPATFSTPGSPDNKSSVVGIKSGLNSYDSDSSFGYRPMASIVGADISYLNNNGSIKKATIQIKAYSPEQLDIIDKLYMRPGYSCLLEWGHTVYLNNKGEKTNFDNFSTLPFLEMISNGTSPSKVKEAIQKEQEKHDGNYEAFYGQIIKFNWKFNSSDATYDINVELISEGNVIESLLLNSTLGQNETDQNPAEGEPSIVKLKDASKFYRFLYDIHQQQLRNVTKTDVAAILGSTGAFGIQIFALSELYRSSNPLNQSNKIKSIDLEKVKESYGIKSSLYSTGFSYPFKIEDDFIYFDKNDNQRYISLGLLLEYINSNHNIFYKNNEDKKLYIDTGENNYCLTHPLHLSSNPKICFVPPPSDDIKKQLPDEVNKFKVSDNPFLGNIMYIQCNINYITKILYELKDKENKTSLYEFLNKLLDDINICLGNINKLSLKILNNNIITIVDEVSLPYKDKKEIKEYSKFNVFGIRNGEGSFIKNIDFNVTITNDMATNISIGAQANGNQVGINSTAFSEFNKDLIDRVRVSEVLEEELVDNSENLKKEKEKNIKENFKKNAEAIYVQKFINDIYIENLSNVNSDICKLVIGDVTEKNIIPAPSFLPFDLNLTMMGLSGMKIFEKFALTNGSEKILPSYYRDNDGKSLIDFIIFDLKHSIKNNTWETTIKGKSIPSETSLEPTLTQTASDLNITENTPRTESDLCPKTAYPELEFINPRPPSTLLSFKDAKNYLTSKYSEDLSKSVFAILYAEASKQNDNFRSAGGYNYAGVQTDNSRWGASGIIGQYCRIDSGGVPRAFAVFENDNSFLDFMANRVKKKGFNGNNADSWVSTYINSWWSPANKSAYTKGTPKYNSKLEIYKSAISKYNNII